MGLFFHLPTHVHVHIRKKFKTAKLAKFAKSAPQKSVKAIPLKQVRIPGSALGARASSGSNLRRFPVRRGTAPAPNSSNICNLGWGFQFIHFLFCWTLLLAHHTRRILSCGFAWTVYTYIYICVCVYVSVYIYIIEFIRAFLGPQQWQPHLCTPPLQQNNSGFQDKSSAPKAPQSPPPHLEALVKPNPKDQ